MKESYRRRCHTPNPSALKINGYEYSFRNSLEQGDNAVVGNPIKRRDYLLESLGDTPKFPNKGKVFFPAERPQTARRQPEVRDSAGSFGKRRSKSEIELVPLNKSNLRIDKIEINYNTFSGGGSGIPQSASKPLLRREMERQVNRSASPSATSIFNSTMKFRTVQQIYSEKLTPMSSSSRNLFVRSPGPSHLASLPLERTVVGMRPTSKKVAPKPFNRAIMVQRRLKDDRLKDLNFTTQKF